MVGSGAVKLASGDPTWRQLTAMTFHYSTQPIPTPLAWYASRLPVAIERASTAMVLAVELIAPWSAFAPRSWRRVGFVLLVGLQALIAVTGNYAFFNLLSAALCLFLLDDQAWGMKVTPAPVEANAGAASPTAARRPAAQRPSVRSLVTVAFAVVTVPVSVVMFLGSAGVAFAPPPVAELADFIGPLRSVNGYGLFAVMTTMRDEIVVEGSNDGVAWEEYEFQFKPGDLNRPPPWVAPHQPRLDWQMWFAALTTDENAPWFRIFCVRLLEGAPDVLGLLARNPFPDRPPRYVRGTLYRYQFGRTTWWTRDRIGAYSPVIHLNP
jgi:hypothetical protein